MRRPGPPWAAAALAALLVGAAGCSSESGILVVVSGSSVDGLTFVVGVEHDKGVFVRDHDVPASRFNVRGRNLNGDPFGYMLKEELERGAPTRVRVLALGYRSESGSDRLRSFAVTEPPQGFVRGEVVRRSHRLYRVDPERGSRVSIVGSSGKECYRAHREVSGKDRTWVIVASVKDLDCDGHESPADCADDDPAVHPQASEVCDGKDNDCDGKRAPPSQICYARAGSPAVCRRGSRACDDAQGGSGLAKSCSVGGSDPAVSELLCQAHEACSGSADPVGCAQGKIKQRTASCTIEADAGGLCPASTRLDVPAGGDVSGCRWTVLDAGGFPVSLSSSSSGGSSSIGSCKPYLVVASGAPPASGTLRLDFSADDGDVLVQVAAAMSVTSVASCGAEPLQCTEAK